MNVLKHTGTLEPLDLQKFRNSLTWAKGNIKGVSVEDVELQCKLHFYDGIPTDYILDVSIKTTYDMSSIRNFGYDEMSRNLKLQKLYKQVFKSTKPYTLSEHIKKYSDQYNTIITTQYSEEQLEELNKAIDHSKDFTFSASGLDKTINSDLKKDLNGTPIETPQLMYMLIAMDTFHLNVPKVIEVYNALSDFKITLPTPELNALRTTSVDYASCCALRIGDNLPSWAEGDEAILLHTAASNGVGVDIADIASIGDRVKKGRIKHNGKIKVMRSVNTHIDKASQDGRRGSATCFVNFYDPEIEDIFALKSPRTAVDKRINDLSYGIKCNRLVYERAKKNELISLFSTRKAPHLNSLLYGKDYDAFKREYEKLEQAKLYSAQVPARDFFKTFGTERFETSAYYPVNIDHVNSNTPYEEEISQSNICVEFMVPTRPVNPKVPNDPAIGICVLGNLNQSKVSIDELPYYTRMLVELQTMLALRQVHPMPQANAFVFHKRDIGLGLSNHAHWMASNGWRYGQQEALDAFDEYMEHFAYNIINASCELTEVFGIAPDFHLTNWSRLTPIDRQNHNAQKLITRTRTCDWDGLREKIKRKGMANCGLMMIPPSESSSVGSNQTSSLEPIRELLTIKDRQGINLKQYAPDPLKLADKYDYAYDRPITRDFIKHGAVAQMWIDKGISGGVFYNPELYENNKVMLQDIIDDMFFAYSLGWKTMYYQNTKIKDLENQEEACAGGGCSV